MDLKSNSDRYTTKLSDILEASARLFATQGYHNTSIRDIARACGTSLAGLYYYFKNKDELLYLISRNSFELVQDSLDQKLELVESPHLKLEWFVRNHLQYFVSNIDAMKVIALEADSLSGEYRSEIEAMKKTYLESLNAILTELNEFEAMRKTAQEIKLAAFALFGMMNWMHTWYKPTYDGDSKHAITLLADQILAIFSGGFLQAREEEHPNTTLRIKELT